MKAKKIIVGLTIILILALIGFLTEFQKAQQQSQISQQAVEFNNQVVNSQIFITDRVESLDDQFNEVNTKEQANEILDNVLADVISEIEKVEALNSPQEPEDFKQSVLALYGYYKEVLETRYRNEIIPLFFDEINNISAQEFSERNDQIFSEINTNITRLTNDFIKEQKEFAEEFNLELSE